MIEYDAFDQTMHGALHMAELCSVGCSSKKARKKQNEVAYTLNALV
jgi:hypothetical protein